MKIKTVNFLGEEKEEYLNLRGYKHKVFKGPDFDKDESSREYIFSTAHKHYVDRDSGQFEDVDTTLEFDDTLKKFIQSKASYACEIPEYADEEINFRNLFEGSDHNVQAKPMALHVKGELLGGNHVLYKDAFGEGIDLNIYARPHGLREIISINKYDGELKDLFFDFEIIEDETIDYKKSDEELWSKSEDNIFTDQKIVLKSSRGESFFSVAHVWDSQGRIKPVDIKFFRKDGKTFLRKTIKLEILKDWAFPIFTDHATDFFSGAGDGVVQYSDFVSNWATTHDAASGTAASTAGTAISAQSREGVAGAGTFVIQRTFLPFDTSSIPDNHQVDSAILKIYATIKLDTADAESYITVVQTFQASETALANGDYDTCGDAVTNPTEGVDSGDRLDITGITTSAYNNFTLNSIGRSWINKSGFTKLGVREGHDSENAEPGSGINSSVTFSTSENAGTTQDPILSVITSIAPQTGRTKKRLLLGVGL